MSSFFVLSLVINELDLCLNGFDMGMSHNPSDFFRCSFNISLESLIILISFLSKMETQASSQSWPKDISEAQCSPSKICDFFACRLRLLDSGMCPVFFAFIVAFFGNCTVGPLCLPFLYISNNWCSVRQEFFDVPLSYFSIIVSCLGGSMIELHNSYDVKEIYFRIHYNYEQVLTRPVRCSSIFSPNFCCTKTRSSCGTLQVFCSQCLGE